MVKMNSMNETIKFYWRNLGARELKGGMVASVMDWIGSLAKQDFY